MNLEFEREVRRWIALDPSEEDRAEIEGLLERGDQAELERRFSAPLTFGTAGLRGPVMAGPAGMNRATVRRATVGVLAWLREKGLDATRGVVVGRDARKGSESFNDEVVAVLLGGGASVFELPSPLPTPLVPYCVKALGAVAGIMITASHNPRDDNGYKLYAADGAQIIPPDDEIVERFASAAGEVSLADRGAPGHHVIDDDTLERYRTHMLDRFGVTASDLAIAYTPLHGVGGATMIDLFARAGYSTVSVVAEQFEPDGSFPTLPFPNPEEPGALDLAIETARRSDATIILANDPDADRLGAAVREGASWRILTGDEIGRLLASSLLPEIKANRETVATTIVSSSMLSKLARAFDVPCATTLTGFKWVARSAGDGVLGFGYEEALGFAVDPLVADKDGLSGALALARLASELSGEAKTLLDRLDELDARFGVHATRQLAIRAEGPGALDQLHEALARLSASPPASLGELPVTEVVDLAEGFRGLPPTEGVWFSLGDLGRVVVRPSGTEAKVKAYIEVTPPQEDGLDEQRAVASRAIEAISADLSSRLQR